jgi:uncharacterized protein (TIGR03435 family)
MKLAVTILFAAVGIGQTVPAFDAATVKLNKTESRTMSIHVDPKLASWKHYTLEGLIQIAYANEEYDRRVGGPSWVDSDTWDVEAASERPVKGQERRQMLQTLLADRFKLKVHTESRDVPEYALVVAKSGSKLHPVSAAELASTPGSTVVGTKSFDGHVVEVAELARWLRAEIGRPVIDRTGLAGKYEVKIAFTLDDNSSGADQSEASVFAALQALGLRLESIRGLVKVLVIDHVEKPVIE